MAAKKVRAQSSCCLWMGRTETLGTCGSCATSSRCHQPRAVLTGPLLQQRCRGIEPILMEAGQAEGSHRHLSGEAAIPPHLKERITLCLGP